MNEVVFHDSSALVKRYVQEIGSSWVGSWFNSTFSHEHYIASVTPVEVVAALTRRGRGGAVPPGEAASACALFRNDLTTDYHVVALTEAMIGEAMTLAEIHALRGYDAVQLAAALALNRLSVGAGLDPILFISADQELNAVATIEGLRVENPLLHP